MATGQITSVIDSVTLKRTLIELIQMIDPQDTPCINLLGLTNEKRFRMLNFPNNKYAWLYDEMPNRTDAVNNGAGYDDNDTSIVVDNADKYKPGDVIKIGDEKIWVGAVDYGTNTLSSLVRGWGSTTAAAIADNATVTYLFPARLEGDDSDPSYWTTPSEDYNYSQIFHEEIPISGSELKAVSRYGIPDTLKYNLMKYIGGAGSGDGRNGKAGSLMLALERTFFEGERIQRVAGTGGAMGGAKALIGASNQTDLNGSLFSEEVLLDTLQTTWTNGGYPGTVIMNAFQKRQVNGWLRDALKVDINQKSGGPRIETWDSDFGTVKFMLNRHCPADEIYVIQPEYAGWVTLRDWEVEMLGKTGDGERHQVIGEYGFVLQNPQAHHVITSAATSL